ncbi:MAG: hypothetical protein KC708_08815 [Anaerolineae bacterium]|nr:hypothetical protein [Anaerolineae bacterium]
MKSKKRPKILFNFADFDLTFDTIMPDEYIENMQDKKRLRSKWLKLKFVPDASDNVDTTFALERNFRGVGVWAIGSIDTDEDDNTRVSGDIGIDYWFLYFCLFGLVLVVSYAIDSDQPIAAFFVLTIVLFFTYLVWLLGLMSLKDKLLAHLEEPKDRLMRPVVEKKKPEKPRTGNPYLNI